MLTAGATIVAASLALVAIAGPALADGEKGPNHSVRATKRTPIRNAATNSVTVTKSNRSSNNASVLQISQ